MSHPAHRLARTSLRVIFGVLLPLAVLLAGAYGAVTLMKTAPRAERGERRTTDPGRLVEVRPLERTDRQAIIEAMGVVIPARAVSIRPRVDGEITEVSRDLEPGGIVEAGSTIVTIDRADYELAVQQREAERAERHAQLVSERVDFESQRRLRDENVISAIEFAAAEAAHESAQAQLANAEAAAERARLDLERTAVKAPFDALVVEENSEIGAIAGTSTVLAELVGIDRFWVELSLPVDDLRWVDLPSADGALGSEVRLHDTAAWGPGRHRVGRIARFTASVNEQSRMATLLIEVTDPLARLPENQGKPSLLIGSYLRAEIVGRTVPGTVAIAREHLRGSGNAWVMDQDDRLQIRELEIAWRGRDEVYVTRGLEEGERLVTSNLPTPVEGMRLRTSSVAEMVSGGEQGSPEVAPGGDDQSGVAQ